MAATLWQSEDEAVWESHLDAIEQRMRASGKTTKYGSLKANFSAANFRRRRETRYSPVDMHHAGPAQEVDEPPGPVRAQQGRSSTGRRLQAHARQDRPLMRFAEAMHDNEVRKASKAAIAAIPDARKACDALTALTGIGVATASVCLAAVDDRLPVMSDEALEAVLGEPEHAKKYDLDSYQRLLEACSAKAKKLGGLWTPRAVEEALFSASLEQPAAKRKRGD